MQITTLIGNGDGAFTRESETSPFRQGQIILKSSVSGDLELQQLLCRPPCLFYPLLPFVCSGTYESACYVFLSSNEAFPLLRLHFNSDGPRYSPQISCSFASAPKRSYSLVETVQSYFHVAPGENVYLRFP